MANALFSSLRARLVLLLLFTMLPVAALLLVNASHQRDALIEEARTDAARIARLTALNQERMVEGARQLLVALSRAAPVVSMDPAPCGRYLQELLRHYTWYENLSVIGPDGRLRCSAQNAPGPVDARDRPFFQRALSTRSFVVGEFQVSRVTGKPGFVFAHPALDDRGKVSAVLVAAVLPRELSRLAGELSLPPDAVLFIADRTGTVLMRQPESRRGTGNPLPPALAAALRAGAASVETAGLDGVERMYFVAQAPNAQDGLVNFIGIDKRKVLAGANRALATSLAVLGVVLLLSLFAGMTGATLLVLRPLRMLSGAAQRVGQGTFQTGTPGSLRRSDEVGQLVAAFDDMAAALEHRERQHADTERMLRASEGRFRQIAENIDQVIWIAEAKTFELLYVNPAYERIWGRSCESVYARTNSWLEGVHPEDRKAATAHHRRQLHNGPVTETYRVVQPGGAVRWIRDRVFPIRGQHGEIMRLAGIAEDVTPQRIAEEALSAANRKLKSLSSRLLEAQEAERQHISRELHDEVGQSLTALKLQLKTLTGSAPPPRAEKCFQIINDLMSRIRVMSLDLRPPQLEHLGLGDALRAHCERQAEASGLAIHFTAPPRLPRLDADVEITCFRIAQEAVANAIRHARASTVWVELYSDGALHLTVADDGTGYSRDAARRKSLEGGCMGIAGMEERAALAGAALEISTSPGQGTEVTVSLPLKSPAADQRKGAAAQREPSA